MPTVLEWVEAVDDDVGIVQLSAREAMIQARALTDQCRERGEIKTLLVTCNAFMVGCPRSFLGLSGDPS
jgi:hypothetical protein